MKYQQLLGLCALSGLTVIGWSLTAKCLSLILILTTALGHPLSEDQQAGSKALVKRETVIPSVPQFCPYQTSVKTGTSNQLIQIGKTMNCGGPDPSDQCSAEISEDHTFGIDVSFGIAGDLEKGLATIGLDLGVTLSEEWSTGTSEQCTGDGGVVCVWSNVPYVNVHLSNPQLRDPVRNPGPCTNPTEVDAKIPLGGPGEGGSLYCVRGATNCDYDGFNYWVEN